MHDIGCHAFREHFVTYAWQWHDVVQTMVHLAVLTDLTRHIAEDCGNKIRAGLRLALDYTVRDPVELYESRIF